MTISGPAALNASEAATYTVSATTATGKMGVDIASADPNSLSVITGKPTVLIAGGAIPNSEITHNNATTALSTTATGYQFTYTMPAAATSGSTHLLYATSAVGISPGVWSHATNFTVTRRPAAPTTAAASVSSAGHMGISWTGGGPEYRVVYKTGAAPVNETDGTAVDVGAATSAIVSTPLSSTPYSFAVFSKLAGTTIFSTASATTVATSSSGIVRYVAAAGGVNTGTCAAAASPCKTITYAMAAAGSGSPGDTISVAPGTYNVALGEVFPIAITSGVQLVAAGTAAQTIIDGSGATGRLMNSSGNNASTLLQGFTLANGAVHAVFGVIAQAGALLIDNGSQIRVDRNIFFGNSATGFTGDNVSSPNGALAQGGAIVITSASPVIVNNVFRQNIAQGGAGFSNLVAGDGGSGGNGQGGAIHGTGIAGAVVRNNTFFGNQGIGGPGGAGNPTNGFGGKGGNGLAGGAVHTNNVSVDNNIFANNSTVGGAAGAGNPAGAVGSTGAGSLSYSTSSATTSTNNLFFQSSPTGDNVGANFVNGDPLFQNAPSNLRLRLTSPAKGAGTPAGAPANDLDGAARPTPPSIGAFEASATATTTAVASSLNPSNSGQAVTFTATLSASGVTGTVTFRDGATTLCANVALTGQQAACGPLSALAAGGHSITAAYSGDATFAASTSPALVQVVQGGSNFGLTVIRNGTGGGTVTSSPAGIDCGTTCIASVASGQSVTLSATPAAGSFFAGWSGGGCTGGGTCVVGMTAATTVTATFNGVSGAAAVLLSTASVDFGGQSMGTTSPALTVTLTNTGTNPLTVSSVTTDTVQFGMTHDCASVASGASCTATLTFMPAPVTGIALLGTTPVSGTLTFVSNVGGSPHHVAIAGSAEKSLVTHYYRSILRRAPDGGGKAFWLSEAARLAGLGANVNETWFAMSASFYFSPEYVALGRNQTEFVRDLYRTFFNRDADGSGLGYWTGQLSSGMPNEVVLASFMFSAEFQAFAQAIFGATTARAEVDTVVDLYRGFLSRLPDNGGFAYWVQQFRTAQCQGAAAVTDRVESISSSFALGSEYAARNRTSGQYVGDLYGTILRRGGDLSGVSYWVNAINLGTQTREQVRRQFIASAEFSARANAIVAQGCLP